MRRRQCSLGAGLVVLSWILAGCATAMKGRSVDEVRAEAEGEPTKQFVQLMKDQFEQDPPLGSEERYVPLVKPAETLAIWFYPRVVNDRFEQGHWVLIKLEESTWNPETFQQRMRDEGGGAFEELPHTIEGQAPSESKK